MRRNQFFPFCALLMALILPVSSMARTERPEKRVDPTPADPDVTITAPKSFTTQQIFLFPLRAPSYILRLATLPIIGFGRMIERHHTIERLIELLSNDEKTFYVYPVIEAGFGGGFTGGVGLRHTDLFDKDYELSAKYMISTDMDMKASLSFGHDDLWDVFNRPLGFKIKSAFRKESDEDFYGIGNFTDEDDNANFGFNTVDVGIVFPYQLPYQLQLTPQFFYHALETNPGDGTSVETVFPLPVLVGFNQWVHQANIGIALTQDTTDYAGAPETGGIRSLSFNRFQGLGSNDHNFNLYSLDATQYIRLGRPRFVLALHGGLAFQQETGGSQIPFYHLLTLDARTPLRAYDRGRFRDHGRVIFNAEYRFPVWDYIDGTLFVDTGRVFDDWEDFAFNNFKYSVGGGIQFRTRRMFLFRIQAAYGGDGTNIIFTANRAL